MFVKNFPRVFQSNGITNINYEIGKGVLLAANTTYFVDISMPDPLNSTVHLVWDNAIIATATVQESDLPAYASLSGPMTDGGDMSGGANLADISIANTTTPGAWLPINAASTAATTPGGTLSSGTLTIAGGTAGGCRWDLVSAMRRQRMQIVVGATGGYARIHTHGKQA